MGVDRTDYLMWGAKVDPDQVSAQYDELEKEMNGEEGRRFDIIYDGMSGQYAVAGVVIVRSAPYEGTEFQEVTPEQTVWRPEVADAVKAVFPNAEHFSLYMFSHFH